MRGFDGAVRIGRSLAGMVAIGLAILPLRAVAACQMIKNAELEVRFAANRPLVEATINGKPVWLEIDTGAYTSVLFVGAAQRLGLKGYDTGNRLGGIGGNVEVLRVTIADFALQNARVKNFDMNIAGGVNNPGWVRGDDRNVVGLLGRDFLGLVDVEFDLAEHKMRLLTFRGCAKQSLAYWTDAPGYVDMDRSGLSNQEPFYFPLSINGYFVKAVLDSGASLTVVSPSVAAHAGISETELKKGGRSFGIGDKSVQSYVATFSNINLGDEKIRTGDLSVTDIGGREEAASVGSHVGGGGLAMLLGADFLHSHRVLIASSQDRIYYTYAGGTVFHTVTSDSPQPRVTIEPSATSH